jgi:hypothetical protein
MRANILIWDISASLNTFYAQIRTHPELIRRPSLLGWFMSAIRYDPASRLRITRKMHTVLHECVRLSTVRSFIFNGVVS